MNGTLAHMTVAQFILSFFSTLTMAYFVRDLLIMPGIQRLMTRKQRA